MESKAATNKGVNDAYRKKYKVMEKHFIATEQENERLLYTLRRAKRSIQALRQEREILFGKLRTIESGNPVIEEVLINDRDTMPLSNSDVSESENRLTLTAEDERKLLLAARRFQSDAVNHIKKASKGKKHSSKKESSAKQDDKKDPNSAQSPRRPVNAYIMFTNHVRETMKEELQNRNVGEQAKLISQKWKELSDEEKLRFKEMSQKDQERYASEKHQLTAEEGQKNDLIDISNQEEDVPVVPPRDAIEQTIIE